MTLEEPERKKVALPLSEWRRIAVKPLTGKKADILAALANVSRAENDKLPLYEFLGQLVDAEWNKAIARGLVSNAMVGLEEAVALSAEPVYVRAEEGA
jgi:hypothetical protein